MDKLSPDRNMIAAITNDNQEIAALLTQLKQRMPQSAVTGGHKFSTYGIDISVHVISPMPAPDDEMLARAISIPLDRMVPASQNSLEQERGKLIGRSLPTPWAYIAGLDLGADCIGNGGWVRVELRGKNGQIGLGILNRAGDDFLVRRFIAPTEEFQSIYLPVEPYGQSGSLIVQNGETSVPSEVEIRSVKLGRSDADPPGLCFPSTDRAFSPFAR